MKKNIIHAIVFLFVISSGVAGIFAFRYVKAQKIQEEAKNYPYFTKHHFLNTEMFILNDVFEMETTPFFRGEIIKYDRLDYSYITIQSTEHTEKVIAAMNYYLFDMGDEPDARKLAEEYGLSYENRMTLEWFNDHIHEAVKIYQRWEDDYLFRDGEWIQDIYDRINSKIRYTHYDLSYVELESLYALFYIKTDPDLSDDIQDYSDLDLKATDYAESVVLVWNNLLFSNVFEENRKGIEKAKELGLSKENPITVDWILEHPREILEIKNGMYNYGALLCDKEQVEQIYERETGKDI